MRRMYMYQDKELTIRPIEKGNLPRLWELIYKEDAPEWKRWDAPYFPHESKAFDEFIKDLGPSWIGMENFWVITSNHIVCGIVTYYFEDEQSHWLEMGIVIHESDN